MRSGQVWSKDATAGTAPRTVTDGKADAAEEIAPADAQRGARTTRSQLREGSLEERATKAPESERSNGDALAREEALPSTLGAPDGILVDAEESGESHSHNSLTDRLFAHLARFDRPAQRPPLAAPQAKGALQPLQGVDTLPASDETDAPEFVEDIWASRWRRYAALSMFALTPSALYFLHQGQRKTAAQNKDRTGRARRVCCPVHGEHPW